MKKSFLIAVLTAACSAASGQFYHHIEIGGSNFTGFGLTTEYRFAFTRLETGYTPHHFYISPKLGVGHIFFWEHALTLQFGLAGGFSLKKDRTLELNTNFSYITKSPFKYSGEDANQYRYYGPYEMGNYLWYSGADYKIPHNRVIWTLGLGALTMIDTRTFNAPLGDLIPMGKIGIGL